MSDTQDPFQFLPPRMLEYIKYPFGLLVIWIALGAGILLSPLPNPDSSVSSSDGDQGAGTYANSESTPSSVGESLPQVLSLSSPENLYLERKDSSLIVGGDTPHRGRTLESVSDPEMTVILFKDADGRVITQAHRTVGSDTLTLEDANGTLMYQVKFDGEECSLQTAAGEKIEKIKVKTDKFNLLDRNGNRLLHGKQKNGAIQVRDESDNTQRTVIFPTVRPFSEQYLIAAEASLSLPLEHRLLILAYSLLA